MPSTADNDEPLRFVVRRWEDGTVLDVIDSSELTPGKEWHQAACWAFVATATDRREHA